jgi:2-succinyl-5-enolpyruvyl-6-hydroxy-3-cyclohexene-1-carboxylate synthase
MYTDNKNVQLLLALLKGHGIKKVVASPGGTNPPVLMSMQVDGTFEMYSCVDERSAGYMACGMAEEAGEPVVICCTGATASRNYMSALTEAFYRKLPLVVITCSRPNYTRGHLMPQVTYRDKYPSDILVDGEHLQTIRDHDDKWDCEYKINKALLALKRHGGGPVHFNVEITTHAYTTSSLPQVHIIHRITQNDVFPKVEGRKVGIFIGAHRKFSEKAQKDIEEFCRIYNAVVFCDHTSGYYGEFSIPFSLIATQHNHHYDLSHLDLLIHLGEVSGDYLTMESLHAKQVWRINEDGEIRIKFGKLDFVFEMSDDSFFSYYVNKKTEQNISFWEECNEVYQLLYHSIPDLPLSLIYIAHTLAPQMPLNCVIHFAIINSLRAWNFFRLDPSIRTYCNVGGFGIDGCTSSLIGASIIDKNKLYFLFTGDLAFFYDLNALGNRHIGSNVRILLLNDGKGAEFTHFMWPKYECDPNKYIAGAGHFGNQSKILVKDYAESLGFDYMQANTKEEFLSQYSQFISPEMSDKPMLFEVFTSAEGQSMAWKILCNLTEVTPKEKISSFFNKYEQKAKDSVAKFILKKLQN